LPGVSAPDVGSKILYGRLSLIPLSGSHCSQPSPLVVRNYQRLLFPLVHNCGGAENALIPFFDMFFIRRGLISILPCLNLEVHEKVLNSTAKFNLPPMATRSPGGATPPTLPPSAGLSSCDPRRLLMRPLRLTLNRRRQAQTTLITRSLALLPSYTCRFFPLPPPPPTTPPPTHKNHPPHRQRTRRLVLPCSFLDEQITVLEQNDDSHRKTTGVCSSSP